MASDAPSTRRRVKLYMLNENRAWDDNGTGHVSITFSEKPKYMMLDVRSEQDATTLLSSSVQMLTAYQKQQETLIVWSEGDNCDYALSFQEKKGCDEVWEKICQFQGKDPSVEITQDIAEHNDEEEETEVGIPAVKLPPCELSRLDEIAAFFVSCLGSPVKRERLSLAIESESYVRKLTDLFHTCEDAGNTDALRRLYGVFKSIFLLNKTSLFEVMFSDDLIFSVLGAMEYDPVLEKPTDHRHYLSSETRLKEVIPLNNAALVQKIHQTYRMQYVMDVVLPTPPQSAIDDNALSTLSSFIFFNKMEIVSMIQDDERFLKNLFAKLIDDETSETVRCDLTLFLKEFCTFSQTLAQQSKENFFKTLSNLGVLEALEMLLGLDDPQMKSAAVDIFCYIVEFSPATVREFMVREAKQQEDEDQLINLVLQQMTSDSDPELGQAMQLQGTIQILVDPDSMSPTVKPQKTEVLSCFYRHCIHILTAPLFAHTVDDRPNRDDYQTAHLLSIIIELLTFCIEHHAHHVKTYVASKNLIQRVLVLLKSKHAFLALAALRLLRKCIGLKDEFYNRHITRLDLFRPVVDIFVANKHKYNLLNSALIELFDFIRVEDIKTLIMYLVEKHFRAFEGVTYVQTFKILKQRYDQQSNRTVLMDSVQSLLSKSDGWKNTRCLDEEDDDEMWFDDDEDEFAVGATASDSLAATCVANSTKLSVDCDQINQFLDKGKPGDSLTSAHQVQKSGSSVSSSTNGSISSTNGVSVNPVSCSSAAANNSSAGSKPSGVGPRSLSPLAKILDGTSGKLSATDGDVESDSVSSPLVVLSRIDVPSGGGTPDKLADSLTVDTSNEASPTSNSSSSSDDQTAETAHSRTADSTTPAVDIIVQNSKLQLHSLVDYPDEDSDDEAETTDDLLQPASKKVRVSPPTS